MSYRPSRDDVYMDIAKVVSQRSSCLRKKVGAVLIKNNHILGTGYNGAAKGQDSCQEVGCDMVAEHCVRTIHSEVNAVISAAVNGVSTRGATLYTTAKPCFRCYGFLKNAEIDLIMYLEEYDDGRNIEIIKTLRFA